MPAFEVTWTIELDADTPEAAALIALDIQRDYESIATCFSVTNLETLDATTVHITTPLASMAQ
jgi:hypothetical protein